MAVAGRQQDFVTPIGERAQKSGQRFDARVVQRESRAQAVPVDRFRHLRRVPRTSRFRVRQILFVDREVLVVEDEHRAEVVEHAVVHVRPRYRDVAQRRRAELAGHRVVVNLRIVTQAAIGARVAVERPHRGIRGNADVEILEAGERFARVGGRLVEHVAARAVRQRRKEQHAAEFLFARERQFAAQRPVVARIVRREEFRLLERGECGAHHSKGRIGRAGCSQFAQRRYISRIFDDARRHRRRIGQHHFERVQYRLAGLVGEVARASVVEQSAFVDALRVQMQHRSQRRIRQARCVAIAERATVVAHRHRAADRIAAAVDERVARVVARRTGLAAVQRQTRVEEQCTPEVGERCV
jgi:hypothetical protein